MRAPRPVKMISRKKVRIGTELYVYIGAGFGCMQFPDLPNC